MTKTTLEQTEQAIADHDGVDVNVVKEGVDLISDITGADPEEVAADILEGELAEDEGNIDDTIGDEDDNELGDNE